MSRTNVTRPTEPTTGPYGESFCYIGNEPLLNVSEDVPTRLVRSRAFGLISSVTESLKQAVLRGVNRDDEEAMHVSTAETLLFALEAAAALLMTLDLCESQTAARVAAMSRPISPSVPTSKAR